jgi:hypothetical protein
MDEPEGWTRIEVVPESKLEAALECTRPVVEEQSSKLTGRASTIRQREEEVSKTSLEEQVSMKGKGSCCYRTTCREEEEVPCCK